MVINGADRDKPILVLDFDGTICIGDAPVWSYAEAVLDAISRNNRGEDGLLRRKIRSRLAAFLDGVPTSTPYSDGYDAVAQLTAAHATPRQLRQAYAASRVALAAGELSIMAPPGLAEFLTDVHRSVVTILVTNAPDVGVRESLSTLALDDAIDRVVTDAHKPDGWEKLLPGMIDARSPEDVMVVGDIWTNDIAVPLRLGCSTALIDRFRQNPGPAHAVADNLPSLYPGIRQWALDPSGFVATHPLDRSSGSQSSTIPTHRTGML